jgi:hypothetical protein
MRHTILVLFLLLSGFLVACGAAMDNFSTNDATPVIRTDFSDEAAWKMIQKDVAATSPMGFSTNVQFIDDRQYNGLSGQELLRKLPDLVDYGCVFVADAAAISSPEHDLLVLDPSNPEGETFRVIPAEAWSVENNLSLANMDYGEFMDSADPDGVFRGFK